MNIKTLSAVEAAANGFATINDKTAHVCIDIPDGQTIFSVRTSDGKLVTMCFVPYEENGAPQCVDVLHHTAKHSISNGREMVKIQRVVAFSNGRTAFRSKVDDEKPTTLITVLLHDE